ncbi:hypothetical protein Tco_1524514 [Tanacetum coccineum]
MITSVKIQPSITTSFTSFDGVYEAKEWLQVEVYSMRKSCWKVITQKFPSQFKKIYDENEVCLDGHDGHLHWLGCHDESDENGDSSAPQGVRHGEELGGAPPVDPGKFGGVERGCDPRCSTIGICQRRETLPLRLCIDD